MKMKVTTKTTERATTTVPHAVFVRFLRSLGATIPTGARLNVHQPSGGYSDTPPDVHIHWDLTTSEEEREISMMDDEDIQVVAGLHDPDVPF